LTGAGEAAKGGERLRDRVDCDVLGVEGREKRKWGVGEREREEISQGMKMSEVRDNNGARKGTIGTGGRPGVNLMQEK
jgi:hypothetical protein